MANVYMFRHQAGGFIPEFLFAHPPTDQQRAVVKAHCDERYGSSHVKTAAVFWLHVVEVPLRGGEDLPMPLPPGARVGGGANFGAASVGRVGVDAVGHVENPKG